MERGGGRGLGDDLWSWRGKQKRSSMNVRKEKEMTENQESSPPGPFVRAIGESIRIRDGAPEYYPWAAPSSDFSYQREDWLQMRDSDPEATFRADVRRNEAALRRMKNQVLAAEYSRLLPQEHGQQHCTFQQGSWPGDQQHLQYLMPGPDLQPGEQQQSADSTFGSWPGEHQHLQSPDLQAGQQQYPAYLPCDPTSWPDEQPHPEQSMTELVSQPGEQQQPADSTFELDPSSRSWRGEHQHLQSPDLQAGQQQYPAYLPCDPTSWPDEQPHPEQSMTELVLQPGEEQQFEDSTFELDPSSRSWPGEHQHLQSPDLQAGQQQYPAYLPFDPTSWPDEQPHPEQSMTELVLQPGEQQQSADSTSELDPSSRSWSGEHQHLQSPDLQAGQQQYPAYLPCDPTSWPDEQPHPEQSMTELVFQPAEQQQSADSTSELDPSSRSWSGEHQHLQSPDLQAGQQQYPAYLPCDPTSWPDEQPHPEQSMTELVFQPGEQQQSADSTFELDPISKSWPGEHQHLQSPDLQAGQPQYPAAYLPSDPTSWSDEQPHPEQSMTGPALQPGEEQQSADSTIKLDPSYSMLQMEDLNSKAPNEVDMSGGEVLLQFQTEVNDASGEQHSGHPSSGPSALHGEPQHSKPSSSQPGSSSGEQQHAACLMPGPSSRSGECPLSASKIDEVPGSSSGSQSGQQQPLPHSSSAGEQQHLEPAAAGGSLPTEQQTSGSSWSCIIGPTGRPGKWQLHSGFGWLPVPFPKELLPAEVSRRMQQQRSSSQTGAGQRVACSSQPGDRRHAVAYCSQLSDRRHPVVPSSRPRDPRLPPLSSKPGDRRQHPVASSSQPRDHRLPPLSSKPGDRRQHPVASSSQPDDQRRHPVASSSRADDRQRPAIAAQPDQQQQQDEARPTSCSVPGSEAGEDSACHPHVPGSQHDQLEGGHKDRE